MRKILPFTATVLLLFSMVPSCRTPDEQEGFQPPPDMLFPDSISRFPEMRRYIDTYGFSSEDLLGNLESGYIEAGGYRIFTHLLKTDAPASKGSIWIAHGYLHNSGYYSSLAMTFMGQGWNVVFFDLPGHGFSSGEQAGIRDFAEYAAVLRDLSSNPVLSSLPRPWVGLGHSTGVSMFIEEALERAEAPETLPPPASTDLTDAAAADSPLMDEYVFIAPLIRSTHWTASTLGLDLTRGTIRNIPRSFPRSSANRQFLRFMKRDDFLGPDQLAVSWINALVEWNKRLLSLNDETWRAAFRGSPVHILQGDKDNVVDFRYNLPFLEQRLEDPSGKDFSIDIIEDGRHDLHFETTKIRDRVLDRIFQLLP